MAPPTFINTFLDSPILVGARNATYAQFLVWLEDPKIRANKRVLAKFRAWKEIVQGMSIDLLDPIVYRNIYHSLPTFPVTDAEQTAETLSAWTSELVELSLSRWGITGASCGQPVLLSTLPYWGEEARARLPLFRDFVDSLASNKGSGRAVVTTYTSHGWTLCGDEFTVMMVDISNRQAYMCSYEQILMWKDLLWGRFNVAVSFQVIYGDPVLADAIGECLDWCFSCLAEYGNQGYELLKNIESLTKTNIVRLVDPVFGPTITHPAMLEVMRTKEMSLSLAEHPLSDRLDRILERLRRAEHAVELFGLQKLTGHPYVDASEGGKKVRGIACVPKDYSVSACARVRNNFCRMYCEGYIRKHRKWPPLAFPPHRRNTQLYQRVSLQETAINFQSYPLDDWEGVRFRKHHEFEYYPNFTDLMDDKAISYYRDQIAATWDKTIQTRSSKRLLLEMLDRPDISVRDIVNEVRLGRIPFEWLIVSLYPKEREFKLHPRMFSMMVLEMRVFFACTEANVADNIFPYLPPQTMTLPKQEIVEMFHSMTEGETSESRSKLYGEFDIESWNSNFQAPLVDPISRDLGDMHGETNVFPVIHHFFSRCVMMVRVAELKPPGVEEAQIPGLDLEALQSDMLWVNHLAGVEGIVQKQWTAATYSMMDLALQQFSVGYHLIGQADNQIFLATVETPPGRDPNVYLPEVASLIVHGVDEECRRVGHSTKPDECMVSTRVVTYSKDIYIDGVEYYTSLKACSRVFPNSASDFPSVNNSVGALSSQCQAAAEKLKNPLCAYRLWAYHCSWYLSRIRAVRTLESSSLPFQDLRELSPDHIKALLLLPGDLGGLSILPFTNLIYKGGADPLSKSYASLALSAHYSPMARVLLGNMHEDSWYARAPTLVSLLEDPYSLPIARGRTPETSILEDGVKAIAGRTVNRDIRELCSERLTGYEEELDKALLSVRPFNPVLLSDLKSDSVVGVKKQVARMFVTTRTIQTLLQRGADMNPCSKILSTGAGYTLETIRRIRSLKPVHRVPESIYLDICKLRQRWFVGAEMSMTGVTTITPFEFTWVLSERITSDPGVKALRVVPLSTSPLYARGPEPPYLGRPTVEKRSVHGYKIITSSSPERAVARLCSLATQPGVGDSFLSLVESVAQTRADVDLKAVVTKTGKAYGGTIDHRYTSLMGNRGANFIGGTAFPSQCIISTDNSPPLSGGEEDYPAMVQEFMVASLAALYLAVSHGSSAQMIVMNLDSEIWCPVIDTTLEVPEEIIPLPVAFKNNTMAYTQDIYLRRLISVNTVDLIGEYVPDNEHLRPTPAPLRRILRTSLTTSRSAAAVADRGSGIIRISLDLLEMRGYGLKEICMAASEEVARFTIESMYSRSSTEMRWSPTPMILSLCESLSRALSGVFHHPMFKQDEIVIQYGLSTPTRYSNEGSTPITRLRNHIMTGATSAVISPSDRLYTEPTVVFGDEKDGAILQEALSSVVLAYHRSMLLGEVQLQGAYIVIRQKIPRELRGLTSEQESISRLAVLVGRILLWAESNQAPALVTSMSSLIRGRLLLRSQMPVREAIRMARSYPAPAGWNHPPISMVCPLFPAVSEHWGVSHFEAMTRELTSSSWSPSELSKGIDLFSFDRLKSREFGRESSAGYSYAGISRLCNNSVVANIGCGYGSGAAVLLAGGASMVLGVDLDIDLNNHSILTGELTPPAISFTGLSDQFLRYPPGHPGGGDFTSFSVIKKIRELVGESAILVIDIPLYSRDDVLRVLASVSSYAPKVRWIIRLIKPISAVMELHMGLVISGVECHVRNVFATDTLSECWLIGESRGSLIPRPVRCTQSVLFAQVPVTQYDLSSLGGGTEYIWNTILSPSGITTPEQAEEYLRRTSHLLAASVGDHEHRFTYNQWTEVLASLVLQQVAEDKDPRSTVQAILEQDTWKFVWGDFSLDVVVTLTLRRKLTRLLPRVL